MGAEDTFPVVGEIVKGGYQSGDGAEKWDKLFGSQTPEALLNTEQKLQKEFAQHGVTWRVEDAKRAGINPAYALGAAGASYSPMAVMQPSKEYEHSGLDALVQAGQGMFRSISAMKTPEQRAMDALNLENASLQNDFLRTQIHAMQQSQLGPGFPNNENFIPGQGNSNLLQTPKPLEKVVTQPGRRGQDPSSINDYGFVQTPTGLAVVPSKDAKERIEDQLVPETMWAIRNQIMPAIKGHTPPDPKYYPLPEGYDEWRWNAWKQEFQPARSKKLHWENQRKGRY